MVIASCVVKLFDDESTHKKHTVMTKWEILGDDSRNEWGELTEDKLEEVLEFGKSYKITIEEIL
jgi:hypothetical protein